MTDGPAGDSVSTVPPSEPDSRPPSELGPRPGRRPRPQRGDVLRRVFLALGVALFVVFALGGLAFLALFVSLISGLNNFGSNK
jgi:hypothetical protein